MSHSQPRRKQKFKSNLAADKALRRVSMDLIEQLNLFETSAHLHRIEGVTLWEMEKLTNSHNTELERKQYLVTTVLPSKGHYRGMRLLRRALRESKQDELLNTLEKAYEVAVDEVIVERLRLSQAAEVNHETETSYPVQPEVQLTIRDWHDSIINSAAFSGLDLVYRGSDVRNSRNLHRSTRLSSSSSSSSTDSDDEDGNSAISLDSPLEQQQQQWQQQQEKQQQQQQQQPLPSSYVNVLFPLSQGTTATISVKPSSYHSACDHISDPFIAAANVTQPEQAVLVTVNARPENSNNHNADIHNVENSNHDANYDRIHDTDAMVASVNELTCDSPVMKFVFVGDAGTGKTSLLERYINNKFSIAFEPTIIDFKSTELTCYNTKYKLYLWDTAGQEKFKALTRVFYRDAVGAFVIYDVTQRISLEHCLQWKMNIDDAVQLLNGDPIPIVLIANKIDQIGGGQHDDEQFSKENGFAGYFETSAKTGAGIKEAIHFMTKKIHELSCADQEPVVRTLSRSRVMSIKLKDYGDDNRRKCCRQI